MNRTTLSKFELSVSPKWNDFIATLPDCQAQSKRHRRKFLLWDSQTLVSRRKKIRCSCEKLIETNYGQYSWIERSHLCLRLWPFKSNNEIIFLSSLLEAEVWFLRLPWSMCSRFREKKKSIRILSNIIRFLPKFRSIRISAAFAWRTFHRRRQNWKNIAAINASNAQVVSTHCRHEPPLFKSVNQNPVVPKAMWNQILILLHLLRPRNRRS